MPDSLLFDVIGGLVDSLAVVFDSLGWWLGVLGPDGDPVKCVTMEEVGCECVAMEEAVCGATDTDAAADCVLGPAERLLGAVAIFATPDPVRLTGLGARRIRLGGRGSHLSYHPSNSRV